MKGEWKALIKRPTLQSSLESKRKKAVQTRRRTLDLTTSQNVQRDDTTGGGDTSAAY